MEKRNYDTTILQNELLINEQIAICAVTTTNHGDRKQQQAQSDVPEISATKGIQAQQPVTRSCHQDHQVVVEEKEAKEKNGFAAVSATKTTVVEANASVRCQLDDRCPPTATLVRTMISPSGQSDASYCKPMLTLDKNVSV